MKKEIKQKWVEALKSGEYKQGLHELKRGDKFCCLGVLCDLHSKETGIKWNGGNYLNSVLTLPEQVQKWAGFRKDSPSAGKNNLTTLNDGGKSFNEIADLIDKYL